MFQLQFVVLAWFVIVPLAVAATFHLIALFGWRHARATYTPSDVYARNGWDFSPKYCDSILPAASWIPVGAALFFGIILAVCAIPFGPQYWVITDHAGTVSSTTHPDKGIVLNGDSSTNYVITLAGDGTQYVVNDARALSVKVGQHIDLACTLQWNYGAKDQFNCSLAK